MENDPMSNSEIDFNQVRDSRGTEIGDPRKKQGMFRNVMSRKSTMIPSTPKTVVDSSEV